MCCLAVTYNVQYMPSPELQTEKEGSLQKVCEVMALGILSPVYHIPHNTQLLNYSSCLGKLLRDGVLASVDQ